LTVQTIVATTRHDCTALLGQFLDEEHFDTIIDSDTDFYIPRDSLHEELNEDRVGFIFRKNYFSLEDQKGAYEGLHEVAAGASNNRGLAAGPKVKQVGNREWLTACQYEILNVMKRGKTPLPGFDPVQEILDKYAAGDKETTRGCMWLLHSTNRDNFKWSEWLNEARKLSVEDQKTEATRVEDEYISISTYASPVHSGVAGTMDRYPRYPYARYCAYNRDNHDQFAKSFPFLQRLSDGFKDFLPIRYAAQKAACDQIDTHFVVPGTVFTTITVNKTFRTGAHLDAGDLEAGFSNLSVITDGHHDYTGGMLVLPEYRTAINIRPGDLLLVANHNIIHGNTPIEGSRVSLVCYFREGLLGTGSYEYEQARYEYIELRKKDPKLSAGRTMFNGVTAGCFSEQVWYDFCISKIGEEETYKMHPEAIPQKISTLFD
jgi:hypothetical protein